jgi:hypothetical protein
MIMLWTFLNVSGNERHGRWHLKSNGLRQVPLAQDGRKKRADA